MARLAVTAGVAWVTLAPATSLFAQCDVNECGMLVAGTGCVFFETFSGSRYEVDTTGFVAGDFVRVAGTIDECTPACPEADACLVDAAVDFCFIAEIFACGTLILAPNCILFETRNGYRYQLDRQGPFSVGDVVFIAGEVDLHCPPLCIGADSALLPGHSIDVCCECDLDGNFFIDVGDLLAYLSLWFAMDSDAEVDFEAGIDIRDLLAYLTCWFPVNGMACF